jgi:hypothetical protein
MTRVIATSPILEIYPMPKLPPPTEHGEQSALIEWVRWHLPQYPALSMLFAIPNGGARPAKEVERGGRMIRISTEGHKLKAEGQRAGVPDLFLAFPALGYPGLFIEMKRQGEYSSPKQLRWQAALKACGYAVWEAFSMDEAKNKLLGYIQAAPLPIGIEWPEWED